MEAAEVTRLLEATRDDLVRDVVATLNDIELMPRLMTPGEIERLRRIALSHLHAAATIATRYEQAKHEPEPSPAAAPEDGWVTEQTSSARPRALRRRRTD